MIYLKKVKKSVIAQIKLGLVTIILKTLTLFAGLFIFNNILSVRFLFKIKTILGPLVFRLHNIKKKHTYEYNIYTICTKHNL